MSVENRAARVIVFDNVIDLQFKRADELIFNASLCLVEFRYIVCTC